MFIDLHISIRLIFYIFICFTSFSYNIQLHINYILQLVGSSPQLVPITQVVFAKNESEISPFLTITGVSCTKGK